MNINDDTYAEVDEVSNEAFNLEGNICYGNPNETVVVRRSSRSSNSESVAVEKNKKSPENDHSSKKKLLCTLLTVIVITVLIILTCACFIYAFIEIDKLNSEIASLQETSSMENETQHLNTLVNMFYSELSQNYSMLEMVTQQLIYSLGSSGQFPSYPATSCAAILLYDPSSTSGHYWVRSSNGSAVRVYCDMARSCGGISGGWMRVAELDMTNSSTQCPSSLMERTDSNIRTCVRNTRSAGCSSVTLFTNDVNFKSICGKIIAYQIGITDAFQLSFNTQSSSIEGHYVDGVSLTHGSPRQHIWSFAAGRDETPSDTCCQCPCSNINITSMVMPPPVFVGNDYFCDTGSNDTRDQARFYSEDPLWDGAGCGPQSTCCSFNNPPWFYKQLPQFTTDDIEMRVCRDNTNGNEDTAIEMFEIYIQ